MLVAVFSTWNKDDLIFGVVKGGILEIIEVNSGGSLWRQKGSRVLVTGPWGRGSFLCRNGEGILS